MESMIEFIKKLSTSKMVSNTEEGGSRELSEAINIFSDRIRNASVESLERNSHPFSNNGNNNLLSNTQPVSQAFNNEIFTGSSPVHKIIKKRYKQTRSKKKPRYANIDKPPSPLNKEQLKLLHDPASFDKYAKDLEIEVVKDLYSEQKTRILNQSSKARPTKASSASRSKTKKSRNKVSPL